MGAVIATIASYTLGVAVLGLRGRRHVALPMPVLEIAKISVAALAMWPILMLVPEWGSWPELFTKAILGGVTYITVAFLLDAGGARAFVQERISSKSEKAA